MCKALTAMSNPLKYHMAKGGQPICFHKLIFGCKEKNLARVLTTSYKVLFIESLLEHLSIKVDC